MLDEHHRTERCTHANSAFLWCRNLVYTGLTRAKQLAMLVGLTKAIGISIKRVTDRQRYTALADRLRSISAG
jgi:ATP-dependent exoDNAse (exonuclease V) alpha subunit